MKPMEQKGSEGAHLRVGEDQTFLCQGVWTLPHVAEVERIVDKVVWPSGRQLTCDGAGITAMDTAGAVLLRRTVTRLEQQGRRVLVQGLRAEVREIFDMVTSNWPRATPVALARPSSMAQLNQLIEGRIRHVQQALAFLGESAVALARSLKAPARIRWRALFRSLELDGFNALPITGLLTFLIGVVIAYQGAEQLRKFGTNIFIVDLVGISLLREIAPLIVAIVIAGRSGSAYAAEIGTMKVTEELDAVRTLGIWPMDLLVLPRTIALVIALPLLTVYADVLGVFGGMLIASGQLNVSFAEFVARFEEAVALRHFLIGIGKAPFFAMIIALVGCYQGFQIRGGVEDVGRHTTISVVQSIFLVIIFDAICSILLNWWAL
jgi:phospholipid/cholesterol/gamma-HCH transport system permease protein